MLRAKTSASACVTTPTSPLVQSNGGKNVTRQSSPSYQQCTGSSAAPVVIASFAEPAGILVGSPKKSTWTPVRLRSRSAIRHTNLLSRSRSLSNGNGGCSPPDSGITSKPRLSR